MRPMASLLLGFGLLLVVHCHAAANEDFQHNTGTWFDVVPGVRVTTFFGMLSGLGGTMGISTLYDTVEIGIEGMAWYAAADELYGGLSYGGYLKLRPVPLGCCKQAYIRAAVSQLHINHGYANLDALGIGYEWQTDAKDGPPQTVFLELTMTRGDRDVDETDKDSAEDEDEPDTWEWGPFFSFGIRF